MLTRASSLRRAKSPCPTRICSTHRPPAPLCVSPCCSRPTAPPPPRQAMWRASSSHDGNCVLDWIAGNNDEPAYRAIDFQNEIDRTCDRSGTHHQDNDHHAVARSIVAEAAKINPSHTIRVTTMGGETALPLSSINVCRRRTMLRTCASACSLKSGSCGIGLKRRKSVCSV